MAVKFHGAESIDSRPPPVHGQHTTEVLLELGYSDSQIRELYSGRGLHLVVDQTHDSPQLLAFFWDQALGA